MSQNTAIYLVLILAVVLANGPFLSQRFLGLCRLQTPKSLLLRLCELALGYILVGFVGRGLEQHLGQIAEQSWVFYVASAALFLVLALPGFVYRYLLKH